MKVLVVYPKEYKTPFRIETVSDEEDAKDLQAEVHQGFGQALVLTDKEYHELIKIVKEKK